MGILTARKMKFPEKPTNNSKSLQFPSWVSLFLQRALNMLKKGKEKRGEVEKATHSEQSPWPMLWHSLFPIATATNFHRLRTTTTKRKRERQ